MNKFLFKNRVKMIKENQKLNTIIISLDCIMFIHNKGKGFLYTTQQDLLIININTEFSLNGIMNKNASSHTDFIIFIFPMSFESYWNSIPSVSVNFSQSFSNSLNDSFSYKMWFLLQVRAKFLIRFSLIFVEKGVLRVAYQLVGQQKVRQFSI